MAKRVEVQPINLVDIAIAHVVETLKAQWVDFRNPEALHKLERRSFNRFIIADAPWSWGLWRYGDDIHLYFLTGDNEWRWQEVVTEAMGIEVSGDDLRDATRDCVFDLTDERLCRFRDGRHTQYWFMKHSNPANTRIVLHYCKITTEWLGSRNLVEILKDTQAGRLDLPSGEGHLPMGLWAANFAHLEFLKQMCNKTSGNQYDYVTKVWPYARAWAEANDLWKPDQLLLDPQKLWCALVDTYQLQRIDEDSSEETMFIDTLKTWASSLNLLRHVSKNRARALLNAAADSLNDLEMTLTTVRLTKVSLSVAQPQNTPARPMPVQPATSTPSAMTTRFRDARSAINRLRHDLAHFNKEYDVGYIDRFEGMKWMPLKKWGLKKSEEEDWVAEHRVRQIMRVKDGTVVWDREKRIDLTGDV